MRAWQLPMAHLFGPGPFLASAQPLYSQFDLLVCTIGLGQGSWGKALSLGWSSMALPNDMAIDLRRKLKTTHKVVSTPVIGMIVKGDESSLKKALNAGFSECIEKPFDQTKTEATLYKVMNLDSSARYFSFEKDYLLFKVPSELSDFIISDIKDNMDSRIKNTINEGIGKLIIDVSSLEEIEEEAIEVVGEFAEKIEDLSLPMQGAIIAKGDDAEMWNNLDGCEDWGVFSNLEEAVESLS